MYVRLNRGMFFWALSAAFVLLILLSLNPDGSRANLPDAVRDSECGSFNLPTELANGDIVAVGDFIGKCEDLGRHRVSSFLVHFNANGRLEKSFGEGGFLGLGTNSYLSASSYRGGLDLLARPDGGFYSLGERDVKAFLPDGRKDPAFSQAGLLPSYPGGPPGISAGAVQADGKLLLAQPISGGTTRFAVARYLPSGVIDNSFGDSGSGFTELPGSDLIFDSPTTVDGLEVTENGQIYGSTWLYAPGFRTPAVFRMDANGELDLGFGNTDGGLSEGLARVPGGASRYEGKLDMHTSYDGSVTVLGSQFEDGLPFVSQLDPGGQPIFGQYTLHAHPMGIDSSNRVITGARFEGKDRLSGFSIARHFVNGTPDAGFGNGRFTGYFGPETSASFSARENGEGGYFASGWVSECDEEICGRNAALVKLDSAGRLVDDFAEEHGLAVLPRIKCPLGSPSTGSTKLVVRARCVVKGGEFNVKAAINAGGDSPGFSFTTGPFARPEDARFVGRIAPWTRRTVRVVLPKSVRFIPGKEKSRLFARLTDGFKIRGRNLDLRRVGRTIIAGIDISSALPVRPQLIVGIKPGAIRHLSLSQREKLTFKVKSRQSDDTFRNRVGTKSVRIPGGSEE